MGALKGVSGRAIHLSLYWREHLLAVGSGFVARLRGKDFLVTARHNLAGRHWETNEIMSTRGVEPDRVVLRMQASTPGVLEWANRELPLVDEEGLPTWYEHPTLGRRADIAALELEDDSSYFLDAFAVERPEPSNEPYLSAGDDLFVVGYPRGFTPYVGIPIWVRASVASEPAIGYRGLPVFLVDARTTAGQSGSAVVLRPGLNRSVRMRDQSVVGCGPDDAWIAGVYSGRVHLPDTKIFEVLTLQNEIARIPREPYDIGIVWTTGTILATIEGRTRFPATGDAGARWDPSEDWNGSFDADVIAD